MKLFPKQLRQIDDFDVEAAVSPMRHCGSRSSGAVASFAIPGRESYKLRLKLLRAHSRHAMKNLVRELVNNVNARLTLLRRDLNCCRFSKNTIETRQPIRAANDVHAVLDEPLFFIGQDDVTLSFHIQESFKEKNIGAARRGRITKPRFHVLEKLADRFHRRLFKLRRKSRRRPTR